VDVSQLAIHASGFGKYLSIFIQQFPGNRPVFVGQLIKCDVDMGRGLARDAFQRVGDLFGDF